MRSAILASMMAAAGLAQQVVAPTPETVGSARGEDAGGYNIVHSFEAGYRFADIGGNRGKYRSDVNYRNGLRLLGSSFSINSKDGHGRMFDEILLNTQGLGNDPYEFASLRIQKNWLYRYDMLWRQNDYYNPGLTISEGRHFRDTSRRMMDHDLIFFPQSKIQFRLGYSRNNQNGPALSTVQLFDARGDEFTPFADVKRIRNEYRVGNDIDIAGFKFSWLRSWENFKEDTSFLLGTDPGANGQDVTSLNGFRRSDPYHGNTSFWRGNLHGERKRWAVNARISYVGAKRDFILDEFATGISRNAINRQTLASGDATRPTTAGDLSLSLFPSDRLSVVNNTSVYTTRIDGDSSYTDVNNSVPAATVIFFRFLGIRTITNSTDVNFRATPVLSFYGGYHYSTRLIRSIETFNLPSSPGVGDNVTARQDNHVNSGLAGIRLRPIKPLTISLDGELARADRPFAPISDRNFHSLRGRVQYKSRNLLLVSAYRQQYNTNSVSLSTHSAHARSYSFDSAWSPGGWLSFDAGYSKIHLDTVSGIAFFAAGSPISGLSSVYISNAHVATFGARMAIRKRADLFVGYTITKDTGDGRATPAPGGTTDSAQLLLLPAQTFPLSFQSPLARLSMRLSPKMRWNAGWQFYNYHERFQIGVAPQNYRANTGYTSVLWSF